MQRGLPRFVDYIAIAPNDTCVATDAFVRRAQAKPSRNREITHCHPERSEGPMQPACSKARRQRVHRSFAANPAAQDDSRGSQAELDKSYYQASSVDENTPTLARWIVHRYLHGDGRIRPSSAGEAKPRQ
jgi:hypothetical protein